MPYVNHAKTRKDRRDIKISNHPYKTQAEKDEAAKRISKREKKELTRAIR